MPTASTAGRSPGHVGSILASHTERAGPTAIRPAPTPRSRWLGLTSASASASIPKTTCQAVSAMPAATKIAMPTRRRPVAGGNERRQPMRGGRERRAGPRRGLRSGRQDRVAAEDRHEEGERGVDDGVPRRQDALEGRREMRVSPPVDDRAEEHGDAERGNGQVAPVAPRRGDRWAGDDRDPERHGQRGEHREIAWVGDQDDRSGDRHRRTAHGGDEGRDRPLDRAQSARGRCPRRRLDLDQREGDAVAAIATTGAIRPADDDRPIQRRPSSHAPVSRNGKKTSPAASDSLPVTNPGQAALRNWSLTTRTATAISGTAPSRRSPGTRVRSRRSRPREAPA